MIVINFFFYLSFLIKKHHTFLYMEPFYHIPFVSNCWLKFDFALLITFVWLESLGVQFPNHAILMLKWEEKNHNVAIGWDELDERSPMEVVDRAWDLNIWLFYFLGSDPEGVDDLCFDTYGKFSPPPSSYPPFPWSPNPSLETQIPLLRSQF